MTPRPHLVVDGNNVIGTRPDGWWRDRAGAAQRLLARLQALDARPLTLVLDGRPSRDLPEGAHDGVEVLYTRRGGANAADDRIVELLETLDDTDAVEVVTSDRALAERARALGATVSGAKSLLERLDAVGA